MARRTRRTTPNTTQPPAPVEVRRIANDATIAQALDLAGRDRSRLQFNNDGSITILNTPRGAR